MKEFTLLFLCLVGWSSAYLIKVPTTSTQIETKIAPVGWVHIQKLLLPLFDNVCEASTNAAVVQMANDFVLDVSNGNYMKPDVIENLRDLKTGKGLLPKGEIFTELNTDHMNELKALYEVFYYARDFDTFYRAASWARQNVNCGLFVDTIYLAIMNRKDTAKVSVPAPYELLPNYFINKDVVVRASFLLTADEVTPTPEAGLRVDGNSYVLDANYTSEVDDTDEDAQLAYFREDVGLNSFYFFRKLRSATWFNMPNDVNNLNGERMYQTMKQLAARYDLERYSHGLPELEGFNWEAVVPYDPMLIYSNGNEFDHRTFSNVLSTSDDAAFLKTIENNLAAVVTHLRQAGHNKSQILNHLMDILLTTEKSYEVLCRKLLGSDKDLTERHYSVFEHYMTTLRDPVFWKINKKMVRMIDNALKILPSYSRNELYFPGVEVLNVETKKMSTSFDNFQFDVTDSLKTSSANVTFQVKISQPRLNHKPFIMKLNISSLVMKKGMVKIYIGPKMMPGELAQKKHLLVLLDMFEVNLKKGSNVISRSSEEMSSFSEDFISLRALRKKVEDSEFGLDALPLKTVESQVGYPNRLILPKGIPEGLPLQIFVFVAPITKGTLGTSVYNMELNTAVLSPGYPLDLPIEIRQLFGLPNALVKELIVTHKNVGDNTGNGGRPGFGGRPGVGGRPEQNKFDQIYDTSQTNVMTNELHYNVISSEDNFYDDPLPVRGLLEDRPDFTYKKTENVNYDKTQYGKKEDYASKKTGKWPISLNTDNKEAENALGEGTFTSGLNDNLKDFLPIHQLLGARPEFTYQKPDNTNYADKKRFGNKEDYVAEKTGNRPILPNTNDAEENKQDILTSDINDYQKQILPIHQLLNAKPDYTYKRKDVSDYTAKRTQYRKQEDYLATKTDRSYDKAVSSENMIETYKMYADATIPYNLLGENIHDMKYENDELKTEEKKDRYIKKEKERAAKREQKKEKYITTGEKKRQEYISKGELKKEENTIKNNKNKVKNVEKDFDEVSKLKTLYDTYDELYDIQSNNMISNKNVFNVASHEDVTIPDDILQEGSLLPKLLASKYDSTYKKDTPDEKKRKEELDSKRTQYKKVDYRKEAMAEKDTKPNNSMGIKGYSEDLNDKFTKGFYNTNENDFIIQNKVNNKLLSDVLAEQHMDLDKFQIKQTNTNTKNVDKSNELESKKIYSIETDISMDQNSFEDPDTTETLHVVLIEKDEVNTLKPTTEILKNKKVYITENKLNKDIVINKDTVTKKDITKIIPAVRPASPNKNSTSNSESKELNSFTIYEPVISTEVPKTKKRVTVYDFLFKPTDYDEEELKVYE